MGTISTVTCRSCRLLPRGGATRTTEQTSSTIKTFNTCLRVSTLQMDPLLIALSCQGCAVNSRKLHSDYTYMIKLSVILVVVLKTPSSHKRLAGSCFLNSGNDSLYPQVHQLSIYFYVETTNSSLISYRFFLLPVFISVLRVAIRWIKILELLVNFFSKSEQARVIQLLNQSKNC